MILSCGIDFGTSNSAMSVSNGKGNPSLINVEGDHITIPSALFFDEEIERPFLGRAAIDSYLEGYDGRFMRSLKRVLGTYLMEQGTAVNGTMMMFDQVIALFLKDMKDKAEKQYQTSIENVVMGRPVCFIDYDESANVKAQNQLHKIAQDIGFKNIEFQFEPIAAAFAHEAHVEGEKLAIVIDIGGGTSDFTIIRLSQEYLKKQDRTDDILANTGVRVGGNDFDKKLSIKEFMPFFGYETTFGKKNLLMPKTIYHDLSEWSKINLSYTPRILEDMRGLAKQSHQRDLVERLVIVLQDRLAHRVLHQVEETKVNLTQEQDIQASLSFIDEDIAINISRDGFDKAIENEVSKISENIKQALSDAQVKEADINLIILTGGSTEIPYLKETVSKIFKGADISEGNKLSSVAVGLGYDAQRRFQ